MRKLIDWMTGWYSTLAIKYRNPGLYAFLKDFEFSEENFVEVGPPGESNLFVHKDALETLRRLGAEGKL